MERDRLQRKVLIKRGLFTPQILDEVRARVRLDEERDLCAALMAQGLLSFELAQSVRLSARRGEMGSQLRRNAFQTGSRLGRFEILRTLGRGARSCVLEARDPDRDDPLALKVLTPRRDAEDNRRALEGLQDGIKVLAKLNHPHILPIEDVEIEKGRAFLIMQLAEGGSLRERLLKGPLAIEDAFIILEQVAQALQYAHDRGAIHGDLKPANILFDRHGDALIADFCYIEPRGGKRGGPVYPGKPIEPLAQFGYVAPEQYGRVDVIPGRAGDIYALGAIFFEMLAGRPPFQPRETDSLNLEMLTRSAPPIRRLRPDAPRGAAKIIEACLKRAPARRYRSALRLAEDARRGLEGDPVRGPGSVLGRAGLAFGLVAVALSAALFIAVALWPSGSAPSSSTFERARSAALDETERALAGFEQRLKAEVLAPDLVAEIARVRAELDDLGPPRPRIDDARRARLRRSLEALASLAEARIENRAPAVDDALPPDATESELWRLAWFSGRRGSWERAEEIYARLAERRSGDTYFLLQHARAAVQCGRLEKADEAIARGLALSKVAGQRARFLRVRAALRQELGAIEAAAADLQLFLDSEPPRRDRLAVMRRAAALGRPELFPACLRDEDRGGAWALARAWRHLDRGFPASALQEIEGAGDSRRLSPILEPYLFWVQARAHRGAFAFARALEAAERALRSARQRKLTGLEPRLRAELIAVLAESGERARARQLIDELIPEETGPAGMSPEERALRSRLLCLRGDMDLLSEIERGLLAGASRSWSFELGARQPAADRNRFKAVPQAYQRALGFAATPALRQRLDFLRLWIDAEPEKSSKPEASPNTQDALALRIAAGRGFFSAAAATASAPPEVLEAFAEARRTPRTEAAAACQATMRLLIALRREGRAVAQDRRRFLALLDRVRLLDPTDPIPLKLRALYDRASGRLNESLIFGRWSYWIDPFDPESWENYALSQEGSGRVGALERALALARRAGAPPQQLSRYHRLSAQARVELGDQEGAVAQARSAAELDPGSAEALRAHAGLISGAERRAALERAAALDRSAALIERARGSARRRDWSAVAGDCAEASRVLPSSLAAEHAFWRDLAARRSAVGAGRGIEALIASGRRARQCMGALVEEVHGLGARELAKLVSAAEARIAQAEAGGAARSRWQLICAGLALAFRAPEDAELDRVRQELRVLERLAPGSLPAMLMRALCLIALDAYPDAEPLLADLERACQGQALLPALRARLALERGREGEARTALRRARDLGFERRRQGALPLFKDAAFQELLRGLEEGE